MKDQRTLIKPGQQVRVDFPCVPMDIPNESRRDRIKQDWPELAPLFMERVEVTLVQGESIEVGTIYGTFHWMKRDCVSLITDC